MNDVNDIPFKISERSAGVILVPFSKDDFSRMIYKKKKKNVKPSFLLIWSINTSKNYYPKAAALNFGMVKYQNWCNSWMEKVLSEVIWFCVYLQLLTGSRY